MATKKTIFGVKAPKKVGDDKYCPFHGSLKVRGRTFTGTVVAAKARKTVTVELGRHHFLQKYQRFSRRRTRLHAHNPPSVDAKEGDTVFVAECRPLSKTKKFVVLSVVADNTKEEK